MSSTYLKHKTIKQIEEFAKSNRFIYAINLQTFLGCAYKTAGRIIKKIKERYQIKTKYLESKAFLQYIYEEI